MQIHRTDHIQWLEFELLQAFPKVKHGIFLRHGGHSQGAFNNLNLSLCVGDNRTAVLNNRKLIADQFNQGALAWCGSYHSDLILEQKETETLACDGIITNQPHIGLTNTHADCQVALFYDPVHHAAANVHAGWRGSVNNIYRNAILKMRHVYGTNPADLVVCISPSLGPESAEFIHYKKEFPENFWEFQVKPTFFDFWAISTEQLKQCGIQSSNIQIASIDTYATPIDYFSYRRDKVTGRHASVIMLT